jgi:hypothetical protein
MLLVFTGTALAGNVKSIGPIHISGDTDFATCGCASNVGGVWVIGPWSIAGAPSDGVLIENVTAPFQLVNMTVNKSSEARIHLKNVNGHGATLITGTQTSLQNNNIGIVIEDSTDQVADGGERTRMAGVSWRAATPARSTKTILAPSMSRIHP